MHSGSAERSGRGSDVGGRPAGSFVVVALIVASSAGALACKIPVQITPAPATAPAEQVAISGASVFIGVGDIAVCGTDGDERTARLVDSVLRVDSIAKVNDQVFTLGDNAYPDGSASNFALCFAPSWGDSSKRIMKKIHPAPGNHEHQSIGAAPYYEYFGSRAGSSKKGYYSYDVGEWHVIVLNSEIIVGAFTDADRKAQDDWLTGELKGSQKLCTLAYWHNPRFSSGWHGGDARLLRTWQLLYDGGVDLVLNGHDHDYERFDPQDPLGVLDTAHGIPEYVVGTGGGDLRGFRTVPSANSAVRVEGYWGVLKLTLGKGEFRSAFIDTEGRVWDPSGGKCHTAPVVAAPLPSRPSPPGAGQRPDSLLQ
ncbi:MAG: metallophosphoesterase [Gemmatimonadota bacterium]